MYVNTGSNHLFTLSSCNSVYIGWQCICIEPIGLAETVVCSVALANRYHCSVVTLHCALRVGKHRHVLSVISTLSVFTSELGTLSLVI